MNTPEIIIRDMKTDDISAVSDIICACYEWLGKTEGYTADEISALINGRGSARAITEQSEKYWFIVAEIDRRVVGVGSIRGSELTKLYVKPGHFRIGIGSALFQYAEKIIAEQGYDNFSLGAFPSSAEFYEAMGMKNVGEKISAGGPIKGRRILRYQKEIK